MNQGNKDNSLLLAQIVKYNLDLFNTNSKVIICSALLEDSARNMYGRDWLKNLFNQTIDINVAVNEV